MKRWQKNITLTESQLNFAKENFGRMRIRDISNSLGLNYGKVHNNLRLIGLVKDCKPKEFENEGEFFNVEKFGQLYNF